MNLQSYNDTIRLKYSCLAAITVVIFEAIGYKYNPQDFDGMT